MKKSHIRDYAVNAFRIYAANGEKTYALMRRDIYDRSLTEQLEKGVDVYSAMVFARQTIQRKMPMLLDIRAVEQMISLLEYSQKCDVVDALRAIYFVEPRRPLKNGEISNRVIRYATDYPCSPERIWRQLRYAQETFGRFRGLTVE